MSKCKSFTLTWDLHAVFMAIDTYMHKINLIFKETKLHISPIEWKALML
jgi:hypothetical protein